MTGPEHYQEAERLIDVAHTMQHDNGPGCGSEEVLAEAQVHATLAVAAATALNDGEPGMDFENLEAWRNAAGVQV